MPRSYSRTGVQVAHQKRDVIRIEVTHNGVKQSAHVSYDQAYDLKQQLESFLGAYQPTDE